MALRASAIWQSTASQTCAHHDGCTLSSVWLMSRMTFWMNIQVLMCTGSSPLPAILLSSVTPSLELIEKRFQALVLPYTRWGCKHAEDLWVPWRCETSQKRGCALQQAHCWSLKRCFAVSRLRTTLSWSFVDAARFINQSTTELLHAGSGRSGRITPLMGLITPVAQVEEGYVLFSRNWTVNKNSELQIFLHWNLTELRDSVS